MKIEKEISYRAIGAEKPQRKGTKLHKYELVARRLAQASTKLQDFSDRFDRGDEYKLKRKRDYSDEDPIDGYINRVAEEHK